jgi:ribosomal protein S6--L-glutamate ligase
MKLTILSRGSKVPSTARLAAEARALGHKVKVINPVHVELLLEHDARGIFHGKKKLAVPDVVIPRLAGSIAAYGLAVVDQLSMGGAAVMNDARAIARSRNPMRCLQVLSANGIEIPPTRMVHDVRELDRLVKSVGGLPLLVKILRGNERHGTIMSESLKSLKAALEAVLGLGQDLVLQKYVKGARHLRIWVIGGKAVAAIDRTRRNKEVAARLELELGPARIAERAAAALALEICTVDLLDQAAFEVNATPAFPEAEKIAKVNLAQAVVRRAEALYERAEHDRADRNDDAAGPGSRRFRAI